MARKQQRNPKGWDALAEWYDGWVGKDGSKYHRRLAIPALMKFLDAQKGESILDVGAGQGVIAPDIHKTGAHYTGVDVSDRLLQKAREYHGDIGRFVQCDAAQLHLSRELTIGEFDAAVFLLSIQDMNPLDSVLKSVGQMLKEKSRIVILMTHPAFRIPRQSGWGYDENRKLQYRRIDRYITELPVPRKQYPGASGANISFHRPIEQYVNGLSDVGFFTERMSEIPVGDASLQKNRSSAEKNADAEIPIFLTLRARRFPTE